MFNRIVLAFVILALAVATAGTVPGVGSYHLTLLQPTVVNGTVLKAGEYKLNLANEKVTFVDGKFSIDAHVKVETVEKKFDTTSIRYSDQAGKAVLSEIRIGGTKTKLLFN
jgi:hypothetical protein